jgi:hypothetical protein
MRSIFGRIEAEGEEVAMKIISDAWRTYKSKLLKIWRDLTKEVWVRFVERCESENFGTDSRYMQWLRSHNELDHHLDNTGYARK